MSDRRPRPTSKARLLGPLARRAAAAMALSLPLTAPASADKIKNPVAIFAGLDKITGRIISFEVNVDETVQFGALQLTPRLCYTRPPTEPANTTAFVEVDEVTFNNDYRRIFGGWIFASSPGLHGIEHPIYDVWLTGCKGGTTVIPDPPDPDKVDPLKPSTDPKVSQQQPPAATRRGGTGQPAVTGVPTAAGPDGLPPAALPGARTGQIGIAAPQGVPVAPRQPTQRFFPTNAPQQRPVSIGRDPAGSDR